MIAVPRTDGPAAAVDPGSVGGDDRTANGASTR